MKKEKINQPEGMEPGLLPSDLHELGGAMTVFLQGYSHLMHFRKVLHVSQKVQCFWGSSWTPAPPTEISVGRGTKCFSCSSMCKGIEWFRVMTADEDVFKEVGGTIERGRSFVGSLHE